MKTNQLNVVKEIRTAIENMSDPKGEMGNCEIVRELTVMFPEARRCELTEVLVGDLGLNPFTVRRQIQEVRCAQ